MIDGKDLVFAIHVASYRPVETEPVKIKVAGKPVAVALGRYRFVLRAAGGVDRKSPGTCVRQLAYELQSPGQAGPGPTGMVELGANGGDTTIDLPVPEEDMEGTLLTKVRVSWKASTTTGCAARMVEVRRTGHRIVREMNPRAPGW